MTQQKSDLFGGTPHALMASLAYVGVLVLIPIIAQETKNKFVAFHVRQGIIVLLCEALAIVLAQYMPKVGSVLFLVFFLTSIVGFFFAIQGDTWKIPGVAQLVLK